MNPIIEFSLLRLHFLPLGARALMVMAHKVKDAVNHQEKNFFLWLPVNSCGLTLGCFCRDDHISQNPGLERPGPPGTHGKRDDIGGTIPVKILTV